MESKQMHSEEVSELVDLIELVEEARSIDREVIEKLGPAKRFQYSRVRKDIDIKERNARGGNDA